MRLKSLKLAGFKSFANATTFHFPRGITAIVGPNGCGKSNVIDAIRWVLGETSAKQLRGAAMSDVIFAGTQDKAAKSVASVELTFEHTQDEQTGIRHEFNVYQELSVRRQVNWGGCSDYFINGTRCRRRDVVDVFLGTGLGARSYAVIEQGMIGRIVESSPMQLREFIEEAAGVSRYQARREETQKKLSLTRDNLARLQDMQSELLSQQKRLSKQAGSAERYNALNRTLADIQQQLAIQRLYQAKHTQQQQKIAHEHSNAAVATLQAHYEQLKAKQDKLAAHINQEQWLKDEAHSSYYQQQLSSQHAEHHVTDMQAKVQQVRQQLIDLAQQKTQALTEIEDLKSAQTAQQNECERLHPQLTTLTLKRDAYQREAQPFERDWTQTQHQLASLQETLRALEQQQALNQQSQKRHQLSGDKWQQRRQNWQTLWAQLPSSDMSAADSFSEPTQAHLSPSADAILRALTEQLQQITRRQDSAEDYLSEHQPQRHALQQRLMDEQRHLVVLEKSHALLSGEYDTLHNILHPKINKTFDSKPPSPLQQPVSELNNNVQPRPISSLRSQIELSAKGQAHAPLLDSVLSLWLDSHVFISDKPELGAVNPPAQVADSLWQVLSAYLPDLLSYQNAKSPQNHAQNRHSLWLPSAINTQSSEVSDLALERLPDELIDKVIPLSALITQPHLTLWQQSYLYIADNNASASENRQSMAAILKALAPSALLLTTDGWMISRQGTFHLDKFVGISSDGSDNQSSSPFLTQRLQQRKRLQQLETLLDDSEVAIQIQQQTIKKYQEEHDTLSLSLEEARAQREQLTREKYQTAQQLSTQKSVYERLQMDMARLNTDNNTLEQERQELAAEHQALENAQQKVQINIEALIPKIAEAKEKRQQLQWQRDEFARKRQCDDEEWQALQLSIQKAQMRLEHTGSNLARASQSYDNAVQNEQEKMTQIERFEQQLPRLQATWQNAQRAANEQHALLTERETVLATLKQDYSQQQLEIDKRQVDWQHQQDSVATLTTELALSTARLEAASSHTQSALDNYYEIIHKSEGHEDKQSAQKISVSNLLADFIAHQRRVRPDKIAELEPEQAKLAQQIRKMGAVNLVAIKELNAVNERLQPLTQQIEDITASMQTLLNAIASIDETTKALFMQTLDAVNNELADLFAKVFGGGHASLTLNTDDMPTHTAKSEQWRAGLTLMAQPKGKRNSRLAVLSGGEKTLTALSLIFAIFKQHPAPFCVLDEVDAPLDDANVARFTSLILDLANHLQFIFISHNKLTMQIADELKGITMPTAGISTLVSVSLDEAVQYIDTECQ